MLGDKERYAAQINLKLSTLINNKTMRTEHPALYLLTDLIESFDDKIHQENQKNVTEEMNQELLNITNGDVENVNKWSQMPPISDELYNELLKEFNTNSYYFFN